MNANGGINAKGVLRAGRYFDWIFMYKLVASV